LLRTFLDFSETPHWKPFHPQLGWNMLSESTDSSFPIPVGEGRAEDGLNLRFALPAVMEKDFQVSVLGNQLSIRGERKEPEHFGDVVFFGLPYGRFEKTVLLLPGLQTDNMKARFQHGVRDIKIPYLRQSKAREIPVVVGDEVAAMAAAV
jgi:HSP20 family molecular chaperone IbpA